MNVVKSILFFKKPVFRAIMLNTSLIIDRIEISFPQNTFEYFEFFEDIQNFCVKEIPITSISSKYSKVFWG